MDRNVLRLEDHEIFPIQLLRMAKEYDDKVDKVEEYTVDNDFYSDFPTNFLDFPPKMIHKC